MAKIEDQWAGRGDEPSFGNRDQLKRLWVACAFFDVDENIFYSLIKWFNKNNIKSYYGLFPSDGEWNSCVNTCNIVYLCIRVEYFIINGNKCFIKIFFQHIVLCIIANYMYFIVYYISDTQISFLMSYIFWLISSFQMSFIVLSCCFENCKQNSLAPYETNSSRNDNQNEKSYTQFNKNLIICKNNTKSKKWHHETF